MPDSADTEAATDVTAEFKHHRPWQKNAICSRDGVCLTLQANTENDRQGFGLMDELSDWISAYIGEGFDEAITLESSPPLPLSVD